MGQASTSLLRAYVAEILDMKAMVPATGKVVQSRLFPVDKKGTTKKTIVLDMSRLNKFIPCQKFKITTAKAVRQVIFKEAWIVTLDLKSAYWHVSIHPKFQPLLGFKIEDQSYQFRAMLFGLNIAPSVFTKLCSVNIKELRIKGIKLFAYLDDWIVWAPSYKLCIQALKTVCMVIQKYGFIINQEKSVFIPTKVLEWLGLICDSKKQTFSASSFSGESQGLHHEVLEVQVHHSLSSLENRRANPMNRIFLKQVNRSLERVSEVSPVGYSCSFVTRAQNQAFVLAQAASLEISRSLVL